MLKLEEKTSMYSCLNKAYDDEPVFILRAKDPLFTTMVGFWVSCRIQAGLNTEGDPKTMEAKKLIGEAFNWRVRNPEKCKKIKINL